MRPGSSLLVEEAQPVYLDEPFNIGRGQGDAPVAVAAARGVTSGEILVGSGLCSPQAFSKCSESFVDFLMADCKGINPSASPFVLSRASELSVLVSARKRRMNAHASHVKAIEAIRILMRQLSTHALSRVKSRSENCIAKVTQLSDHVHAALQTILNMYGEIQQEEMKLYMHQRDEALRSLDAEAEERRSVHVLKLLAEHLHLETGGDIVLKKLDKQHPQYRRCQKATTENVKAGFFPPSGRVTGLRVIEVFRLENKPLLRQFQEASHKLQISLRTDTPKMKGLFCSIPPLSLPRVCTYGMFSSTTIDRQAGVSGVYDGVVEQLHKELFKSLWYRNPQPVGTDNDRAESETVLRGADWAFKCITASTPIPFPRYFSRHSTLEESRDQVSESCPPSNPKINYLSLCRVLTGRMHVAQTNAEACQAVAESTYFPSTDEYLIVDPAHVLPEFIILYTFTFKAERLQRLSLNTRSTVNLNNAYIAVPRLPEYKTLMSVSVGAGLDSGRVVLDTSGRDASMKDVHEDGWTEETGSESVWSEAEGYGKERRNAITQKQCLVNAIEQTLSDFWTQRDEILRSCMQSNP